RDQGDGERRRTFEGRAQPENARAFQSQARRQAARPHPRRVEIKQPAEASRTLIEHSTLPRGTWTCAACGRSIRAGETIKISITPGAGRNRVEHDPTCPVGD